MSEIILSSGAYHKYVSGSSIARSTVAKGGYSLTTAVLDILAANTCCTKNIVADTVTADTVTAGTIVTDSIDYIGQGFIGILPFNPPENIPAGTGGDINTISYFTTINTDAGGDSFTLVDGTIVGQLKKIYLLTDGGGNATITPDHLAGGTTITMNDAGDYIVLIWNSASWQVIENIGSTIA
jgi:hypothetical protein